jgi:hypothetical protein
MTADKPTPRPRGSSPLGNFDQSKAFATESENARAMELKRKTAKLREARLMRQQRPEEPEARG